MWFICGSMKFQLSSIMSKIRPIWSIKKKPKKKTKQKNGISKQLHSLLTYTICNSEHDWYEYSLTFI